MVHSAAAMAMSTNKTEKRFRMFRSSSSSFFGCSVFDQRARMWFRLLPALPCVQNMMQAIMCRRNARALLALQPTARIHRCTVAAQFEIERRLFLATRLADAGHRIAAFD